MRSPEHDHRRRSARPFTSLNDLRVMRGNTGTAGTLRHSVCSVDDASDLDRVYDMVGAAQCIAALLHAEVAGDSCAALALNRCCEALLNVLKPVLARRSTKPLARMIGYRASSASSRSLMGVQWKNP